MREAAASFVAEPPSDRTDARNGRLQLCPDLARRRPRATIGLVEEGA